MTLACEDANSKLVDVVTVADDDRVGTNLSDHCLPLSLTDSLTD